MTDPSYEDRFGRAGRRLRRVLRGIRWGGLRVTGGKAPVLVETRWRLGDEVMALPIYGAIRARWPGARLTAHCNYPDLLTDNPHVDGVNVEVSPARYIRLRGAPRDVVRIEHYARIAGVATPETPPQLHYRDWRSPFDTMLPGNGPAVAVATGATWPTKRWPLDRWRDLASRLCRAGRTVVQLGLDDAEAGAGVCLVGRTSVREAACVLRKCAVLVTCDSGLMHLALAVGTPAVALFGPTDPDMLAPEHPLLHALRVGRPCRGCWNDPSVTVTEGVCPRDEASCLEDIAVEEVVATLRGLAVL